MALALETDALLADRLAGLEAVAKGATQAARRSAAARVADMGLPTRRDEYWKFTRPDALTVAEPAAAGALNLDESPFDAANPLTLVFRDGMFDAEASDALEGENLTIDLLSAAADIHWAGEIYGTLETAGQTPVARPLAALNTALATEGVLIHAKGKVERPVLIRYIAGEADVILHHVVKVDEGASLTLLETGTPGTRSNTALEVDVAKEGAFDHIRTQGRDHERGLLSHTFARMQDDAEFKSFMLTANGTLTRNECVIEILGDNISAHVGGAAIGDGKDFHHDDTVFITHDAVHCESRQVFKKVLRNGATGVFQGKILVKPDAQKTDGYQISQSLLLDEDSQFYAKPELEIYADDVACSHGSTTGAIDETALFYLRSRGIERREAQELLVLAFLAEALDEIADDDLRAAVQDQLEFWLRNLKG
ncbi:MULTISPECIES: SufB/SufD family protein [Halocynthiibacter]|uniref:SufD family Fe-S cluster assembly protein n=1 Tax=Halocynthiibacter halioticoli TaxID=2986804 RepID=A0AAE3J342_9RHOB|nr:MULTISPECIES: SufD family Fe-S cluster assembly protein [Halocynthiibacter]MCV6824447.1 SufD family Fe-S cluster assembly protein [Halocynthiibacter halioticoli]MCW4057448.1 SufD family Fe-S cluster assembly protein [Halocynthiibacter sp. SDUM655004]